MTLNGSIQQFEEKSRASSKAGSQTTRKQGSVVELFPENAPTVDPRVGAADDEYWLALSDRLGVPYRLPRRAAPCTVETMKLWLERLDRTPTWHRRIYATTLAEFVELNPRWPLRAFVGLMLEQVNEEGAKYGKQLREVA